MLPAFGSIRCRYVCEECNKEFIWIVDSFSENVFWLIGVSHGDCRGFICWKSSHFGNIILCA
jgi:hypothetical protein